MIKQQPHRLLDQLHIAQQRALILHYTIKYAIWGSDYYPKTMVHVCLPSETLDTTIDKLCEHIEREYIVYIWNRDYAQKSITLTFTNIDYCTS